MIAVALAIAIGSTVSWADPGTGEVSCGRLTSIDEWRGVAWILPDRSPYWYATVPFALVREGCPK